MSLNLSWPTTPEEMDNWKPTIVVRALSSTVLCVARTRIEGRWRAFCDSVPGRRHDAEWQAVADNGDTLDEKVARAIFPEFDEVPYYKRYR